ncbi:hypothetical protein ABN034_20950 [Actinopolymorpha sp. B11F2]|uniref:hypothetical protein n=1 Tax=Actinopolymorpha sp. B11F2 TaxID=3160862 RepID=UPI0032E4A403
MQIHDQAARLRREADAVLEEQGLLAIARPLGETFVGGSYFYDLMTWRDLDLYINAPDVSIEDYFAFGAKVTVRFHAWKAFFTDSRTEGRGLYWGVRLGDTRSGAWKFDIWAVDATQFEEASAGARALVRRLTPETRDAILHIKDAYWSDPRYRDTITSASIYAAVLDDGVRTIAEFEEYVSCPGSGPQS